MCAEKITYNVCMGTGCHEQCILTTYTENGRIVRTERTYVPGTDKPVTGICQKGVIYAKFPYLEHPSRLRYPLKRVGERGEGKFEKISWEQAMDEIGAKLNKIKEESGPEAILVNNFANSIPGAFTALHLALTYRFVHTFGASLLPTPPIDISAGWASIVDVGTVFPYWGFDLDRLASTKYLILWGNAAGWGRAGYTVEKILEAKEKGAKIIDIGSHFEGSASIADEFIPIKPATDYYLAAAMAHILFRDNLIDTDFLTKHTVAPFLVRKDTGKFLREAEIYPQGSAENYLVWNKSPAVPKAVKPHSTIEEEIEPDLFACPVINGIPCITALVQIRDAVMPYSPKVQEKFTGIDANTVERITHEFIRNDDSLLYLYAGMRYLNGGPAYRAAMMLPILAGKLHKGLGGLVLCLAWNDHPIAFNPQIYFAGDPQEAKGEFPLSLVDALREGFPYRALLNVMANPLQSWPNQQLWSETILPKMELVVAYDVRMSGTARWADYVLPDTCTFERMEIAHSRNRVILCEPAIEPNGDVKAPAEFWYELTKRLGIGEHFNKTTEEWLDIFLNSPDPAIANLTPPLNIERLKKEKMVKLNVPDEPINVWLNTDFPTDSGKIEIYSEHFADVGQAVPKFFPAVIHGPQKKRYPLQLFVGRHRVFVMSQFTEFAELRKIAGEQSFLRMNSQDALARNIHAGDKVEVFNNRGRFRCPVRLTEAIPPGMVMVYMSYYDWEGDPPQALMTPLATEEMQDLVTEATRKYCKSHMGFPETLDFDHHMGSGWETLWDNVCEVRKA